MFNLWGELSAFLRIIFFFLFLPVFSCTSVAENISGDFQHERWSKLLHAHNDAAQIPDPKFLLADIDSGMSVNHSRQQTLLLLQKDSDAKCRFPARYILLRKEGVITDGAGLETCEAYQEFIRRVPFDELSLIFASEHLTQPSSIMGHVMLAMSGENEAGQRVDHSASFFTSLDFGNPMSFIGKTLISGAEGFFIIQPLSQSLDNYLFTEQRNVWRYPLLLSEDQRELIQAHLWELGQVDIPYFFQSHNCATLTLDILRLAVNEEEDRRDWISPIDVVRYADRHHLIRERRVLASDRWEVSMLQEFMTEQEVETSKLWIESAGTITLDKTISQELARKLARYQVYQGQISATEFNTLQDASKDWPDVKLELSDYRDPMKSAPDAHLSLGWQWDDQDRWVKFDWLPAAHDLLDNNRNYFGESTLRLSALSFRAGGPQGDVQLNRWTLYETLALNPRDALMGGISGYFHMVFDRNPIESLESRLVFTGGAGVGVTYKLARDIGVYATMGGGLQILSDNLVPFLKPEAGLWIYEVGGMKSWLKIGTNYSLVGDMTHYAAFDHSVSVGKYGMVTLEAERKRLNQQHRNRFSLSYRHYY